MIESRRLRLLLLGSASTLSGGIRTRHVRAQQLEGLLPGLFQGDTQRLQHLRRHPFLLAQQTQQQVLRAHIAVAHLTGLRHRELEHLLGARRVGQLAHGRPRLPLPNLLLGPLLYLIEVHVQVEQHGGRDALALPDQPQQNVLGADVVVLETDRLFARHRQDFAYPISEIVIHRTLISPGGRVHPLDLNKVKRSWRAQPPRGLYARNSHAGCQAPRRRASPRWLPPGGRSGRRPWSC